jgi:hypothetical protein
VMHGLLSILKWFFLIASNRCALKFGKEKGALKYILGYHGHCYCQLEMVTSLVTVISRNVSSFFYL